MLQFYADAFFCQPPVVLGRTLLPYSLGHSYVLEATESRFACGGIVDLSELIGAVLICSTPFQDLIKKIVSGEIETDAKEFGRTINMSAQYQDELSKFNDYLQTYDKPVPAIQKQGESDLPVPWQFVVAWTLMEKLPEDRVWSMPLSLALSYHAAWRREHGDDTLLSEDAIKTLKQMSDDKKKENANGKC